MNQPVEVAAGICTILQTGKDNLLTEDVITKALEVYESAIATTTCCACKRAPYVWWNTGVTSIGGGGAVTYTTS